MGGSKKCKRITWASDVNLCQVRIFLSEESPSQVGMVGLEHLEAKALRPVRSGDNGADDSLPPGFEQIQPANLWRLRLSQTPLLKWRCPSGFEANSEWHVVAGEESEELEAQNERDMRVLEAIYPRPSAIPPNPCESVDVEESAADDGNLPLVPVTAIEDYNIVADEVPAAAANASFTSLMSNIDEADLIDRDLLIRILSNQKMVGQLITNRAATPSSPPSPYVGAPMMKDSSCYKRLIQQHGGGRRDATRQGNQTMGASEKPLKFVQSKDSKSRTMKPCVFFNSWRGCRNGGNCAYQHEALRVNSITEFQSANSKRVKFDR